MWLHRQHLPTCHIWSRSRMGLLPHVAKVITYFFISLFVCKIFPWTWSLNRWTDFDMRYSSRRIFTQGSAFWGSEHSTLTSSPSKPPQNPICLVHIMESPWQIHIRITAWCIELWCWNLVGCLTLPSTWSTHIKFWDPLFISETNRGRKLKFGMLIGICEYYSSM